MSENAPDDDAINAAFREAMDAGAPPSPWSMSEAELHAEVIALCKQHGIWWIHIDTPHHNKTPHLKGFPDLQLIGARRIAFRELKKERKSLDPRQTTWKYRLTAAGADWDIWRPSDLLSGQIARELAGLNHD